MRKPILLIAALMAFALGPRFFRTDPGDRAVPVQLVVAAVPEPKPEAFPENLTGAVVSVDEGARQMTVRKYGWFVSEEITFAVAEPASPILADLHPGDWVQVGYVKAHGHLIARAIVKLSPDSDTGQ